MIVSVLLFFSLFGCPGTPADTTNNGSNNNGTLVDNSTTNNNGNATGAGNDTIPQPPALPE